ncbi:MAG: hypothetical protein RLY31_1594 [Bacteroidota bacterium]|jgi:hypothetical protein
MEAKEFIGSLPVLASHYQYHLRLHPSLSVQDFLQLHYGDRFQDHQGEHDHSRLPLKHDCRMHHVLIHPAVVPEQNLPGWSFDLFPVAIHSAAPLSVPFQFSGCIWQPPRR